MPGISTIIKVILSLLSGVGIAQMLDKFMPGKVKGYEAVSPGWKPMKLLYFIAAFGGGALAWNFLNRKFHILSRRHSPRRRRTKKR